MAKADFDVAIVGAGPGGLVSALYLRRFLRRVILLDGGPSRASTIPRTYNLLGYTNGITGEDLISRLRTQVNDLGAETAQGLFRVQRTGGSFKLSDGTTEFSTRRVILATGMSDVQPPIDNLERLRKSGLLRYCPVCDAFEYRGKRLAVLAQDNHGVRTAIFLSKYTDHLDVIWPPSVDLPAELRVACQRRGIRIHRGILQSIEEKQGGGLWICLASHDDETLILVDACYVALGFVINDSAFRHLRGLKRNEDGHLIAGSHQELSLPGLFAVGDCVEGLAQIAVAAGQAAIAATRIHNQLRSPR